MGHWRFHIGPIEVKTNDPGQMAQHIVRDVGQTLANIGAFATTGDFERLKEAVGELVLNNNLATLGVKDAVRTMFPQLPRDSIEQIVGAGFMVFTSTGNPYLTVIAIAQEFYAEYELATQPQQGPGAPPQIGQREPKSYRTTCHTLNRYTKADGTVELWASFQRDPVFKEPDGDVFKWPRVDIREGDRVDLVAKTNDLPDDGIRTWYSVDKGVGTYLFPSSDTPGLGEDQITQTIVFRDVTPAPQPLNLMMGELPPAPPTV